MYEFPPVLIMSERRRKVRKSLKEWKINLHESERKKKSLREVAAGANENFEIYAKDF